MRIWIKRLGFMLLTIFLIAAIFIAGILVIVRLIPHCVANAAYEEAVINAERYDREWIIGKTLPQIQARYSEFPTPQNYNSPAEDGARHQSHSAVELTDYQAGIAYEVYPWRMTIVFDECGIATDCILEQMHRD